MDEAAPSPNQIKKWISPITVLFILYGVFFLPFWEPLLLAFIFACALAPVIQYLNSKLHTNVKKTSYFLMGSLTALVLAALSIGVIKIYSLLYEKLQNMEDVNSHFSSFNSVKVQIIDWLRHVPFLNDQNVEKQVNQALTNLGSQAQGLFVAGTKAFIVSTPDIILNIFIFLAALTVLTAWGNRKWKIISKFPGLGSSNDMANYKKFEQVCGIAIGSIFLTGLCQAVFVGIGAAVTGFPVFICFLSAFVLSLIPVLGAASVPVFLALLSYANGSPGSSIILIITAFIAGTSDNILRAWLFSKASNTNPVISLLALLGGISLFGFTGLFLAPIVEQLVMSYIQNGEKPERKSLPMPAWAIRRRASFKSPPRPI